MHFKTKNTLFKKKIYLSISPKTTSNEQKEATKSAKKTPLPKLGIKCKLCDTGVLTFNLYGLEVPSENKVTPNSPLGASTAL
jgi:hypothetical protein